LLSGSFGSRAASAAIGLVEVVTRDDFVEPGAERAASKPGAKERKRARKNKKSNPWTTRLRALGGEAQGRAGYFGP